MTQPIVRDAIYRRRRFSREVIETAVRYYITYRLTYRDLVALMADRGVRLSHTTILRWVIQYVPEYERRWNRRSKPAQSSWRVDETFINVGRKTSYLYRAVDKYGKTVESLLRSDRGIAAAQAFFRKALAFNLPKWPRKITLDGQAKPCRIATASQGRSKVEVCGDSKQSVPQQHRGAGPPRHQTPLPVDAGIQVLQDGRGDAVWNRVGSPDPEGAIQVWARPLALLVIEAAMGPRLGLTRSGCLR